MPRRAPGQSVQAASAREVELEALLAQGELELAERDARVAELQRQQAATAGVLNAISSSPAELPRVLDAIAENAARLCGAADATILRAEADQFVRQGTFGSIPRPAAGPPQARSIDRTSLNGRAFLDRRPVQVEDLAAVPEAGRPAVTPFHLDAGVRTILVAPLLRAGEAIGTIQIRRTEVRSFTDRGIALLESFADQAVIAIENSRLAADVSEVDQPVGVPPVRRGRERGGSAVGAWPRSSSTSSARLATGTASTPSTSPASRASIAYGTPVPPPAPRQRALP